VVVRRLELSLFLPLRGYQGVQLLVIRLTETPPEVKNFKILQIDRILLKVFDFEELNFHLLFIIIYINILDSKISTAFLFSNLEFCKYKYNYFNCSYKNKLLV